MPRRGRSSPGVDSSTQACKVVVRDADDRRAGPRGPGAAPGRHRGRPGRLVGGAAGGGRPRPAGSTTSRRSRSAASSTAWSAWTRPARWCARRCCGTTPAPPAAAPTWSPSSAAAQAWADAVGVVPVASFTVTKLRWLAEHEPDQAARDGGGLPAARLADLAARRRRPVSTRCAPTAATPAAPATGRRRPATYRPDLLERGFGRALQVPEVLGPHDAAGRHGRRAARAGHRRQRGRRARRRRAARATWSCRSAPPASVSAVADVPAARPDRHRGRLRRRHRAASCRWSCTLNAPGCSTRPPGCSASTTTSLSRLALSAPAGRRRAGAGALPGGRAHPGPAGRDRRAARPHADLDDPGAPGPGRGRGPALRAGRRPRRAGRAGRRRAPGAAGRRRRPVRGGPPARAGGLRLPGRSSRRRGSTSPTAPPGRPPGCSPGPTRRRSGPRAATEPFEADPTPAVRARYAEARDLTADPALT